jgi:hypothetical protein
MMVYELGENCIHEGGGIVYDDVSWATPSVQKMMVDLLNSGQGESGWDDLFACLLRAGCVNSPDGKIFGPDEWYEAITLFSNDELSAIALQQCEAAFPGLKWIKEKDWDAYEGQSKTFRIRLTVQENESSALLFVGDTYWRSSVNTRRSPFQALAELREVALGIAEELQSVLGEK